MNSGALTKKQILLMEERTSFFINLAGIHTQETLGLVEKGVPTRKLYKVLANVITEWHWLSFRSPEKFSFEGTGWLVWVPHRFGALGLVASNLEYSSQVRLHSGVFPNVIDLFTSGIYAKYGFRGVRREGDERHLLFAPYMPFDLLQKSRTGSQERHFWPKLVEVYAKLDDKTLDALSSCRNESTCAHSLWIQLVSWKRHMGTVLDLIQQNGTAHLRDEEKDLLRSHLRNARACVKQFAVKLGYRNDIAKYIEAVRQGAAHTEFAQQIPCLDEIPTISSQIGSKCEILANLSESVYALHGICGELRKLIDLDHTNEQPDKVVLERNLGLISQLTGSSDLLDLRRWLVLLMNHNEREMARLCFELVDSVFGCFEKRLDLKIMRPTPHYKAFLSDYYPLPSGHFIKGN